MDVRGRISTLKQMLITSFVLSVLTLMVLIYVTSSKTNIKPVDIRSRSYHKVKAMLDFIGRNKTLQSAQMKTMLDFIGRNKTLQSAKKLIMSLRGGETRAHDGISEQPVSTPNNYVSRVSDHNVSCHMSVVVRGYVLHFRDIQPQNRTTWCSKHSCLVSVLYSSDLTDILAANVTFFSHLSRLPPSRDLRHLVENRRPDQRYILMSYETPLRVARNTTLPTRLGRMFHHWLATYDPSSDIPFPYGEFKSLPTTSDDAIPKRSNYFKLKSELVAFVSSNCIHTKWRRLDFVLELQKYIPVDIYGRCGNLTCEVGSNCTELLRRYKFILALENSPCPGYISEKFWNAIWKFQSVAIAWGADSTDYEKFTPPGSYVYVEDFQSIESLAGFIKEVGGNETLYNDYHKWRTKYRVDMAPDLVNEPTDEHVCRTVDRYIEDTSNPNKRNIRYRDTNGRDWIKSCRIPVHTRMETFPIPVR